MARYLKAAPDVLVDTELHAWAWTMAPTLSTAPAGFQRPTTALAGLRHQTKVLAGLRRPTTALAGLRHQTKVLAGLRRPTTVMMLAASVFQLLMKDKSQHP